MVQSGGSAGLPASTHTFLKAASPSSGLSETLQLDTELQVSQNCIIIFKISWFFSLFSVLFLMGKTVASPWMRVFTTEIASLSVVIVTRVLLQSRVVVILKMETMFYTSMFCVF